MTDNIILRPCSEFHGIQSFTGMRIDRARGNPTDRDGRHLPYRDSKLTRLLQPALSGGSLVSIQLAIAVRQMPPIAVRRVALLIFVFRQPRDDGAQSYRDSKLTRLLQPALSGGSLVSILCTIQLTSAVNYSSPVQRISWYSEFHRYAN
jgi:hypothetical protein